MSDQRPLHRVFGLSWIDFFRGTDVEVEPEMDLSLKQQFVDLVIIRKGSGTIPRPLPDGFEDLGPHNLVTFKSHQEALDPWALEELIGHYVNYRKQSSPKLDELKPREDYRLYAVSMRFPQNLAALGALRRLREGVYEVAFLDLSLRIIVVHQLPQEQQNAMLLLFSALPERLQYAQEHYRPHSQETSTLLYNLFQAYQEDPTMSARFAEFVRQTIDEMLRSLPPEKRLEGLSPEERLKGLSPEERLQGLPSATRLEGLTPQQRLEGLTPEQLRTLLSELQRRQPGEATPTEPQ